MKNILFLHSDLGVAGAEVMRLVLLRNIDKGKYNIKLCCIGRKGVLGREIEKLGYKVDELKQNLSSINIATTYKLVKYLKEERPDILHSSLFHANFHGRLAGLVSSIPHLIIEEHGQHKQYKGIKFFPYILMDFLLSRFSNFIICCSEELKNDIVEKEKLPRNRIISIENCLDLDMYKIKRQREELRKRYDMSEEMIFITVAGLKVGKGHEYLIEAFREVKDMGYSFKCFFAGDGPLKNMLRNKCHKLGLLEDIIFLGHIEGIADYLNASDVFMLPSFSEGLSIALMEGMLMGLASIVTDVGANSNLIKTGFNGTLVSPGDKRGLRDTIIFYLQNRDLIKEFGKRSMSIIETRYSSVDKYIRRYCELWDKCIDNKR